MRVRYETMEQIEEGSSWMQCKVCGAEHQGQQKPASDQFYAGCYKCRNGCSIEIPEHGEEIKE